MTTNKHFNTYKEGLDLEFLREYCIEHGERRSFLRGETLEEAGEPAQWVAFVERGCFKYMVHNDEEGKDYCTGFAFEGEFVSNFPYCLDGDGTTCLIYDQRNLLYECNIATTPTGLLVQPTATTTVTLVDKGGGEWLYLENGDPHPLRATDSTINIQRMGILYTFSRADSLYSEWGADIRDIIDSQPVGPNQPTHEVAQTNLLCSLGSVDGIDSDVVLSEVVLYLVRH